MPARSRSRSRSLSLSLSLPFSVCLLSRARALSLSLTHTHTHTYTPGGRSEIIKMLVGKGADVEMVNDMGQFLRIDLSYLRLSGCHSFPGSIKVCKALSVNDMGQFLRRYSIYSS